MENGREPYVIKHKSPKGIRAMFFIWFLLMNMQNLIIFELPSGGAFKLYHAFSVLFLIPLVMGMKIAKLPAFTALFAFITVFVSVGAAPFYSVDPLLLNYIFSFYTLIVVTTLGAGISPQEWLLICKKVYIIMLSAVYIKAFVYRDALMAFLASPCGHPDLPLFYGGGVNLEATWIALGVCFFLGSRGFLPALSLSMALSGLYASRVGIVINICCLVFYLITFSKKRGILRFTLLLSAVLLILAVGWRIFGDMYIFERIRLIGRDAASVARLRMWRHVGAAFIHNPLGYGAGNAVAAIMEHSGASFWESNIHNLFFQVLLDFGLIGFLAYMMMLGGIFLKNRRLCFSNQAGVYMLCYFAASLIQFRGADSIAWFVFGVYVCTTDGAKNKISVARI